MKETLICKLDKHYIYYLSGMEYGFYILVPFRDYNETNISFRFKSNYQNYDPNKNPLETIREELINYYKAVDNYNITLILPVFYSDMLSRIITVDDMEIYQKIDLAMSNIFNEAYSFLTKNNIKVNQKIYAINNDSFTKFTNWFVSRYSARIEYKTIVELVKENNSYNSFNVVETPNINFVVSKNAEPKIERTAELEVETFDNMVKKMNEEERLVTSGSAGFVSYILLGIISLVLFLGLLFVLIK